MDITIAKWIIEFLLRQKIDDKIINGVISCLPLVNNDYRLKKTILLRRIETETSNGVVSEKIMELIELIEALDYENGKTASGLLKEAYCAVAVDCTVRFIGECVEENGKYGEMVEIVWRNRVCKSIGLGSEMSREWLSDIEKAEVDSGLCGELWVRNTRNEALRAVRAYLKDAWACLGQSFLELVAVKVGNEVEALRRGSCGGGGGGEGLSLGIDQSQTVIKRKRAAPNGRRQRGAKISDAEEAMDKDSDIIRQMARPEEDETREVEKVEGAITSSTLKLPAVGDHHSDNVLTAQTLPSTGPIGNNNAVEVDQVGPKTLESCETRMQMARNREYLQKALILLSSISTKNPETASGNLTGPDVLEISKADQGQKAKEMTQKTVPNTGNDSGEMDASKDLIENGSGNGENAKAGQMGPEIVKNPELVRTQIPVKNSTRELHTVVCDPIPEALQKAQTSLSSKATNNPKNAAQYSRGPDMPTVPGKTLTKPGNDAGASEKAEIEMNVSKGSTKNDQVGPKMLESREVVRKQRALVNSTTELRAAKNDPLLPEAPQKAQTSLSFKATNNPGIAPEIPTDPITATILKAKKAQEIAHKTVPNPENDVRPSNKVGTERNASEEMAHKTVRNSGNDVGPSNKVGTERDASKEMAHKTVRNSGNAVGPSNKVGAEKDVSKGSIENDPNVKETALNEGSQSHVTGDAGIQRNLRKRSLMEPNGTSHTFEWDDEIENSAGSPTRPRIPSQVQRTSPWKKQRRESKRWTPLEEDTLREGVRRYGRGNWKIILVDSDFAEAFRGRTEVDLKDKWRNLTKHS